MQKFILAGVVSKEAAIEAGRVTWGRFEREVTPEEWSALTTQQRKVAASLRWTDRGYVFGGDWKTSAVMPEVADESIDSLRAAYDEVLAQVAKKEAKEKAEAAALAEAQAEREAREKAAVAVAEAHLTSPKHDTIRAALAENHMWIAQKVIDSDPRFRAQDEADNLARTARIEREKEEVRAKRLEFMQGSYPEFALAAERGYEYTTGVLSAAAARVEDALEGAGFGAVYTLVEGSEEYRHSTWNQRKSPSAQSFEMLESVEKAVSEIPVMEEFLGIEVHDVLRIEPHEGKPFTGTLVTITSPGCNDRVVVVSFEA